METKRKEKTLINIVLVFRFYGPLEGYIAKTWVMNDFELRK
jgi:hypothetical protein